jgi:hypothetical protein
MDNMEIECEIAIVYLMLDTQKGFANNIKEFFSLDSTGQEN